MFTIVTDSTAYFSRREAERMGVQVLPMTYSAGSMTFNETYLDECGRFRELIARNLRDMHTSQVTMSAFLSIFNELLRRGKDILCLTISSRMSGTFGNALIAAREMHTDRIAVVDALSTAAGLRFFVERAYTLSQEGATLREAVERLEVERENIGIALSVDDMAALRRSGRLGFVRQSVGTVLNVRPILHCKSGTVISVGSTRGAHGQVAELIASVPKDVRQVEILSVDPGRASARMLDRAMRERFRCSLKTSGVGPVLAIHLGLSAIGVAWMR